MAKRLSDFCKECKTLRILKRIVRDGDIWAHIDAKKLLDEKLGPDPNRDQPPGQEDHPGLRCFVSVEYEYWDKPVWMEETGNAEYWSNESGGRCPKSVSNDGMKIVDTKWAEGWDDLPHDDSDSGGEDEE